jgi:hypothetical protein
MAALLSGRLDEFEPARLREIMTMLVGSAYGSSLDAIAG